MARTNAGAVQALLAGDYDTKRMPDLQPRIDTATAIVDRAVACAAKKGAALTAAEQELMERWLAAHFYTKTDPVYASKGEGGASASFMRGDTEPYKEGAINVDYSGCLKAILERQVARIGWMGKPPSAQIPYDQRS